MNTEQILIHYHKTDDDFLLSIISGEKVICYNQETQETINIIEQIKNIID